MRKQDVLYDIHGCLADFVGGHISALRVEFPAVEINRENLDIWDFWDRMPCENTKAFVKKKTLEVDFIANLEVINEGLLVYKKLVKLGHNVRLCTAPLSGEMEELSIQAVSRWIRSNLGEQALGNTIFSIDKTGIPADVIIDDNPSLTKDKPVPQFKNWLIVDHPYNRILPETSSLLPAGRIHEDYSNHEEVFVQFDLI